VLFAVDQMTPDAADHLGLVNDEINRGSRAQVSVTKNGLDMAKG
jgi:hypothetical protein